MKAWQAQAMWEDETAAEWERLNAPDPYEFAMRKSAKDIGKALSELGSVVSHLSDAYVALSDTPMQAKISSLMDSIEDINYNLWSLKTHWERGERE